MPRAIHRIVEIRPDPDIRPSLVVSIKVEQEVVYALLNGYVADEWR